MKIALLSFLALAQANSYAIEFENRAACAADSKLPARSAFLIVDSYNAGKLMDSWLKGTSASDSSVKSVEQGLKLFRLSLTETWMTLMEEILEGRLPLLSANEDINTNQDEKIAAIFQKWKELPEGETYERRPRIKRGLSEPTSSCFYIKRFSELQSNLSHDRPDQALLQKIAIASQSKDELITDCFDETDSISSRRFLLQVDVDDTTRYHWKKYGFDFWFSMKTYFSHAWRHPELILKSDHPLTGLFKSLAIEQMIMLVPNGCESIEPPQCSLSQLSMDLFRSLGTSGAMTELDHPFPASPIQYALKSTIATHREEAATIPDHRNAEEWLQEFQSGIIKKRGLLKQKLLLAVSQFELLSTALTSDRISSELSLMKREMTSNPNVYQKMQVLCSEFDVAARPEVNFLEDRFKNTLEISKFKTILEATTDLQLKAMMDFYFSIARAVFPLCEEIRIEKLWRAETTVAVTAYSEWYRDLTGTWSAPVPDSTSNNLMGDLVGMGEWYNRSVYGATPLIIREKITATGIKESSVICEDASDCARMLLKSMVDLHAISSWIDSMAPAKEWIQSPHLTNPWVSSTACKMYDPWFATKQAMVGLISDLISTTATGILPVPAYLSVQPKHREVKDFVLDPRGDDLFLKPVRNGSPVDLSIGIDLGPWSGIPCAAIFSPTSNIPLIGGYYTVAGIRAEACTGANNHRLVVRGGSPNGVNMKKTHSGCAICYLNPYSATTGLINIAGNHLPSLKIAIGAIFSGIAFAKRLSNRIDIPKRFDVNPDLVEDTYRRFSFIPKRCVRRLSKGRSCRHVILTKSESKDERP